MGESIIDKTITFRAFSALLVSASQPGPLGRAITFGAFGAVQPRMQLASLGESDMLLHKYSAATELFSVLAFLHSSNLSPKAQLLIRSQSGHANSSGSCRQSCAAHLQVHR